MSVALDVALVGSAAIIVMSSLLLVTAHVRDRFETGWVQGTRMALARYVTEGELYPALYDGEVFGGTRFMPLPSILHAGVAQVTDDFLLSGKLASALTTVLLLGTVFVSLRRAGTRMIIALTLTSAVLATRPGYLAAITIQGDALPVVFQVAALEVIRRSTERRSIAAASVLCVLAFLSKLSALWAPVAIAVWLVFRAPRRLVSFIGWFVGLLAASIATLQWITAGRMLENITSLAVAGISGPGAVVSAPLRALTLISDAGPVAVLLAPLAIVGTIHAATYRSLTIVHVALPVAVLLLVGITTDEGVLTNHVLDVVVLAVLVVGAFARETFQDASRSWAGALVAVTIVWASLLFAATDLERPVIDTLRSFANGDPAAQPVRPLAGVIEEDETILSEDPYVPIALGQRPVVLDAWALLRLENRHPEWTAGLAARIDRQEFDHIVLANSIDAVDWYRSIHLGDTVAAAIRDKYRLLGSREGYYVYVPDAE